MKHKETLNLTYGYYLEVKTKRGKKLAQQIMNQNGYCSGIKCGICPFRIETNDKCWGSIKEQLKALYKMGYRKIVAS